MSRTCSALDAVGVALSDSPHDTTGPVVGASVWGCYIGAFAGMGIFPILPPLGAALGAALGGLVGAWMSGQSWATVLMWSLPGVLLGLVATLVVLAVAIAYTVASFTYPVLLTTPVLVVGSVLMSILGVTLTTAAGPLTVSLVLFADDQNRGGAPAALASAPIPSSSLAQRY